MLIRVGKRKCCFTKTEQLKSLNIAFIEQPLPVNDWQGMQNPKATDNIYFDSR